MTTKQMIHTKISEFVPEYIFTVLGITWFTELEPFLEFILLFSGAVLGVWKLVDKIVENRKKKKK